MNISKLIMTNIHLSNVRISHKFKPASTLVQVMDWQLLGYAAQHISMAFLTTLDSIHDFKNLKSFTNHEHFMRA